MLAIKNGDLLFPLSHLSKHWKQKIPFLAVVSDAVLPRQFLGCSGAMWGWSQLHLLLTAEHIPALPRKKHCRFGPCCNTVFWWGRAGDKVSLLVWMSVVVKLASWAVSMTTAFCAGGRGHAPVISMKRTMRECTLFKAFIFQYVFEYNLEIAWLKGKVYFYA